MTEIHFIVEEAPEGGFIARAVGAEIFTEAERIEDLHAQIRDAVHCHFDEPEVPRLIRLHITHAAKLFAALMSRFGDAWSRRFTKEFLASTLGGAMCNGRPAPPHLFPLIFSSPRESVTYL